MDCDQLTSDRSGSFASFNVSQQNRLHNGTDSSAAMVRVVKRDVKD